MWGPAVVEKRLGVRDAPGDIGFALYFTSEFHGGTIRMYQHIEPASIQQAFVFALFLLKYNSIESWFLGSVLIWAHVGLSFWDICGGCTCASASQPHAHGAALARLALAVVVTVAFGVELLPYSLLAVYETWIQYGYALYERIEYYDR